MRLRTLLAFALVAVCGPSCTPASDRTEVDPIRPNFPLHKAEPDDPPIDPGSVDLLGSQDFTFAMGEGSGMMGLETFRVRADGQASYTFAKRMESNSGWWQEWRKAEFRVAAESVTDLRRLLADINYYSMKRCYHANIADGTQWCIKVEASGKTKKVFCDNHFPRGATRLSAFIHRVLKAHQAELDRAVRISERTAIEADSDLWPSQ